MSATNTVPRIGKAAPHFECDAVVGDDFEKVSLTDFKGKYLVVLFYPLDFTFVCPTEICAFNDALPRFRELNCEVVGVSCDSKFSHLAFTQRPRKEGGLGAMEMPLLADFSKEMARNYGVLVEDGDDAGVSLRGLFIIDDKQVLRACTIHDLPVGRSVEETLRVVQAFRFTDEHGEVCPANWKPGEKTIKPSPAASQEFFSATAAAAGAGSEDKWPTKRRRPAE